MRLSESIQQQIVASVRECVSADSQVWLFGSRSDDDQYGGDIDLFIESPALESCFMAKIKLKMALEDLLGEQKIDVLIHQQGTPLLPIHKVAIKTGLRLC